MHWNGGLDRIHEIQPVFSVHSPNILRELLNKSSPNLNDLPLYLTM